MDARKPFQLKWWMLLSLIAAAALVALQFDPVGNLLAQVSGLTKETAFRYTSNAILGGILLYVIFRKK